MATHLAAAMHALAYALPEPGQGITL